MFQQAERDSDADSDEGDDGGVSKKKRKSENRLKIAALKQLCPRPEVVEVWDVTAPDPQLLVYLKVSWLCLVLSCVVWSTSQPLMGW